MIDAMRYSSGQTIEIGDSVRLEGHARGVVVGIIDEQNYASSFKAEEWNYLGSGLLVDAEDAGLTHYQAPKAIWVLLSRALT